MAVPKNKTSHARKSSRRSTVWKINAPELTACPNCGELTAAHKACTNCGMYSNFYYKHYGRQLSVRPFVLQILPYIQKQFANLLIKNGILCRIKVYVKMFCEVKVWLLKFLMSQPAVMPTKQG